jgi:hypothetical protein
MRTITFPSGTYAVDDQLQEFEIIQKESTNVEFVGIEIASHKVYVQFKSGSGYMYSDVDLDTLSFLPAAASIGKFVSSYLVKKFPSEKLGEVLVTPVVLVPPMDYLKLKSKADKWDALDNQLAEMYGEGDDDNEQESDLVDVGEICATAFGYL